MIHILVEWFEGQVHHAIEIWTLWIQCFDIEMGRGVVRQSIEIFQVFVRVMGLVISEDWFEIHTWNFVLKLI